MGSSEIESVAPDVPLGLIRMLPEDGVDTEATKLDIAENPKNLDILEIEAAQVPNALNDAAFGVINANYAFDAGVIDKLLVVEGTDQEQEDTYVNVIVVAAGNEQSEKTQALVSAVQSDEVRKFIEDTFNGAVVPKF